MKISLVWDYFEADKSSGNAKCLINGCGDIIANKGSTKCLSNHLKSKKVGHGITKESHEKKQESEVRDLLGAGAPSQKTLEATFDRSFSQASLESKLTEWIVLAQAPFNTVESMAFRRLVLRLNHRARIPGADALKNRIMIL